MPIDYNLPVLTTAYNGGSGVLDLLRGNVLAVSRFLDGETVTNPQTGIKKYDGTAQLFKQYNGSSWVEMPLAYVKSADPILTGIVSLNGASGSSAVFRLSALDAATDQKNWRQYALTSGALVFDVGNDAGTASATWLQVARSGTSVTGINFFAPIVASSTIKSAAFQTSSGTGSASLSSDTDANMLRIRVGPSSGYKYATLAADGTFNADGNFNAAAGLGTVFATRFVPASGYAYIDAASGSGVYLLHNSGSAVYFGDGAGGSAVASVSNVGVLTCASVVAAGVGSTLQVYGGATSGSFDSSGNTSLEARVSDASAAVMSFLRSGSYGIKFGLDTDNSVKLGGWSAGSGSIRVSWDTSGNQVTAGNVTAYSDMRFKAGIEYLCNATDTLLNLQGFTYTDTRNAQRMVGISAQDLQRVLPEAVLTDINGYLSVAYGNAALALLAAVTREFNERITQLEEAQ